MKRDYKFIGLVVFILILLSCNFANGEKASPIIEVPTDQVRWEFEKAELRIKEDKLIPITGRIYEIFAKGKTHPKAFLSYSLYYIGIQDNNIVLEIRQRSRTVGRAKEMVVRQIRLPLTSSKQALFANQKFKIAVYDQEGEEYQSPEILITVVDEFGRITVKQKTTQTQEPQ